MYPNRSFSRFDEGRRGTQRGENGCQSQPQEHLRWEERRVIHEASVEEQLLEVEDGVVGSRIRQAEIDSMKR